MESSDKTIALGTPSDEKLKRQARYQVHPKVAYERVRPPCQVQSRLPGQYRILHITREVLTKRFGICRP